MYNVPLCCFQITCQIKSDEKPVLCRASCLLWLGDTGPSGIICVCLFNGKTHDGNTNETHVYIWMQLTLMQLKMHIELPKGKLCCLFFYYNSSVFNLILLNFIFSTLWYCLPSIFSCLKFLLKLLEKVLSKYYIKIL